MTEPEWAECRDPGPMLAFLRQRGTASERKLRLFAVACVRRVAHLIPDAAGHKALVVAERYADRLVTERALHAIADVFSPCGVYNADYGHPAMRAAHFALYPETAERAAASAVVARRRRLQAAELEAQVALLRCLFDSFAPPSPASVWNSGVVVGLAQAIYEERAFDRLPVLADALEEAGCADAALLAHCRQPGEHARGCRGIDFILGKA
jgi:hypothetical protein